MVSQWGMDLTFDDPTFLVALLFWYVVVKAKPGLDFEIGLFLLMLINIFLLSLLCFLKVRYKLSLDVC